MDNHHFQILRYAFLLFAFAIGLIRYRERPGAVLRWPAALFTSGFVLFGVYLFVDWLWLLLLATPLMLVAVAGDFAYEVRDQSRKKPRHLRHPQDDGPGGGPNRHPPLGPS